MKPSTLLVTGALTLASSNLMAYQIVESRFHVEVAPNKFVDQLVLRCEDGRQVTVPWQSKLAESCGEDLMGNVTIPPAKAGAPPIDEQQKQAMLEQLRSQYGNISEKQVEFISGPGGVSTRFKPPIVEILKKYESCRKALKDKSYCAGERDKALARLADPKPTPAAGAPESTESAPQESAAAAPLPDAQSHPAASTAMPQQGKAQTVPSVPEATSRSPAPVAAPQQARAQSAALVTEGSSRSAAATAATQQTKSQTVPSIPEASARTAPAQPATSQAAASESAPGGATPQAAAGAPATEASAPAPTKAELRAAAEQKINQDYMACMRAKPKFDCDQARTKSMAALDEPKLVKPRKPTATPAGPQAQR